jgi:UDP-glucose 4-epimerase
MAIRDHAEACGWRTAIFRYFNAAGAATSEELHERHDPETHLVPLVMRAIRDRRRVLSVFGDDYDTPDGTCIRDYVHVLDIVDAHVLALERLLGGKDGGVFNLGSGRGNSVREVIEAAARVHGAGPRTRVAPRRPGDPPRLVASRARARTVLGWKPSRSSLARILADT